MKSRLLGRWLRAPRLLLAGLRLRLSNMDVTSLDCFRFLRFLRHIGKAMLLLVFGLAWLEIYAVFTCALGPSWRSGGFFLRLGVFCVAIVFITLVGKERVFFCHG